METSKITWARLLGLLNQHKPAGGYLWAFHTNAWIVASSRQLGAVSISAEGPVDVDELGAHIAEAVFSIQGRSLKLYTNECVLVIQPQT